MVANLIATCMHGRSQIKILTQFWATHYFMFGDFYSSTSSTCAPSHLNNGSRYSCSYLSSSSHSQMATSCTVLPSPWHCWIFLLLIHGWLLATSDSRAQSVPNGSLLLSQTLTVLSVATGALLSLLDHFSIFCMWRIHMHRPQYLQCPLQGQVFIHHSILKWTSIVVSGMGL